MNRLLYKIKATVDVYNIIALCRCDTIHLVEEYYNDCMLLVSSAVSGKKGI